MFFNTALLKPWNIGFIAVVSLVAVIFWNAATNKFHAFHGSNASTGAPTGGLS
jgi:hypothetical protein